MPQISIEEALKLPIQKPKKRKPLSIEEALALPIIKKPNSIEEALSAPVINGPSAPAQEPEGAFSSFQTGVAGPLLRNVLNTAADIYSRPLETLERAGRAGLEFVSAFDPAGNAYEPTVASQEPRLQELRARAAADRPEALKMMELGMREEEAKPRTRGGRIAGAVGTILGEAAFPTSPEGAVQNVVLAPFAGAALSTAGKVVAPIIRRVRAGRGAAAAAAESIPTTAQAGATSNIDFVGAFRGVGTGISDNLKNTLRDSVARAGRLPSAEANSSIGRAYEAAVSQGAPRNVATLDAVLQSVEQGAAPAIRAMGPATQEATLPAALPASSRVRPNIENLIRAEEGLPLLEAADIAASKTPARAATAGARSRVTGPRAAFEAELQAAPVENLVTAAERDGVLEVIGALRKAGLLTGFKTHLKNLGGNLGFQLGEEAARLPGAIVDIALSARTGQRTFGGPSLRAVGRSAYEAASRGLKEAGEILRTGGTAEDLARLEVSRELRSGSKILDSYVNTVFRTLNAEDRIARVFAYRRALEDRARAQALSEARSGAVARGNVNSRAQELVDGASESLRAEALADAETAVFANPNAVSDFIAAGRQKIATRPGGRAINATIDLFLPFVRTPTNVIARMLDFTPLGLAKANNLKVATSLIRKAEITPAMQRRFSQSLGRASIGSALIALGARLYDRGLLTGFREDDPTRRARDEAAGRTPGALLIGDTWRQIAGFAPLSNLLVLGATLQRESNQEREESVLGPVAEAGAQVIGEQPLAIGAQQIASALREPGSTAARLGGGIAGSFVPTAVSDVAQAIDQTGREAQTLPARVAARVPGLRGTLPEDVDVLGQPRQAPGPVGAIADPTRATTDVAQQNPVLAELVRLDYGVSGFRKDMGESDDDYRRRVQNFGRLYQSFGAQLVSSPQYRGVTDEDRRFLFKTLNDRSKQLVDEGQLNRAQSLLNPASLFAALLKRRGRQEAERRKTGRR